MAENQNRSVGGFLFKTEQDAILAQNDEKKIAYLEERINYAKPESILYVYEKAIKERIFKTPVGWEYLKRLRTFLLEHQATTEEDILDIVVKCDFDTTQKKTSTFNIEAIRNAEKEKRKAGFVISVVLNLLLVLAICAMFAISLNSENPNILNYETQIQNKYAAWEQTLTDREMKIREKEKELAGQ